MKIPATFTYEGVTWRVRYKRLPKDVYGETSYAKAEVYIDPVKCKSLEARQQVLVHELLHIVLPDPKELPLIHVERLIERLEGPIVRVLASFDGEAAPPASRVRRARRSGPRAVESDGTPEPRPTPASDDPPA